MMGVEAFGITIVREDTDSIKDFNSNSEPGSIVRFRQRLFRVLTRNPRYDNLGNVCQHFFTIRDEVTGEEEQGGLDVY